MLNELQGARPPIPIKRFLFNEHSKIQLIGRSTLSPCPFSVLSKVNKMLVVTGLLNQVPSLTDKK